MKMNYRLHRWVISCVAVMLFTLSQFAYGFNGLKPCFEVKGFHLDLRIQVMTMPALKNFASKLQKAGINTLIMEWEASYPYSKHKIISSSNAYTREEIRSFIAYCDSLQIDVIPLQQSFGHVEYILKHYRYKEIREDQKDYSQVNPTKEAACRALFKDLYTDMIGLHHSKYIHIGGDETYLLGHSKESKKKADSLGMGRLYGDYIKMLCDIVVELGKVPVLWADIALKYPEALNGLPASTVFVDWNYGWELDRFGDHKKLMQSGFEIWGAPAIRSAPDSYYLTSWEKHLNNIFRFTSEARELGYKGMIVTSWSTSGIYDGLFESASDLIDLHPVRNVYPISGFELLIDAAIGALRGDILELTPNLYIQDYGMEKYGLSRGDAQQFSEAIRAIPYEVAQGKVVGTALGLKDLVDSARIVNDIFKRLSPLKSRSTFEHYRLMANIRYNYLMTMAIEFQMNGEYYNRSTTISLLKQLESLNVKEVDDKFENLNKYTLLPSELKKERAYRNHRYYHLLKKLKNDLR